MMNRALSFTGHRPELLPFDENEQSAACIRMKTMIFNEIKHSAANGCATFLNGGARGGDIIFAEQVLLVKATEYPDIRLVTVVPHEGQANRWSESWRERYFRIHELSAEVITLASRYSRDCYHIRNRCLVDNADKLLALYNGGAAGGTAYTVKYARQKNREIIIINPNTLERTLIPPRLQAL